MAARSSRPSATLRGHRHRHDARRSKPTAARQTVAERAGVEIGRAPELVIFPAGRRRYLPRVARARRRRRRRPRVFRRRARRQHRLRLQRSHRRRARSGRGQRRARRHQEDQRVAERRAVRHDRSAAAAGDQHLRHAGRLPAHDPLPERGHPADAERSRRPTPTTSGPTAQSVDAHVYAGWTYDYYFKRFGRRGLDNREPRAHQPRPPGAAAGSSSELRRSSDDFYHRTPVYFGDGVMVYGEGLPAGFTVRRPERRLSSRARSTSSRTN